MPKHKVIYDPVLKETPEWKSLYAKYKNKTYKKIEGFADFVAFYNWAMESGFEIGAKLARFDESKPYCESNCYWEMPKEQRLYGAELRASMEKWNETVNRIRVHYGMEPFESEDIESDETIL